MFIQIYVTCNSDIPRGKERVFFGKNRSMEGGSEKLSFFLNENNERFEIV